MDGGPPVSTQPEPGAMILNPHYALGQLVELKKDINAQVLSPNS